MQCWVICPPTHHLHHYMQPCSESTLGMSYSVVAAKLATSEARGDFNCLQDHFKLQPMQPRPHAVDGWRGWRIILGSKLYPKCLTGTSCSALFGATAKILHKYRDYFFPVSVSSVFPKRFNRSRNKEQCTSHDPRMQFLFHAISEETLIGNLVARLS